MKTNNFANKKVKQTTTKEERSCTLDLLHVELHLRGLEGGLFHKVAVGVTRELAGNVEKGLFEVVVGLGRDVIVLQVFLAVEKDVLGLDFAVIAINLVTDQHNGNVLAHAHEILVPMRHILVSDTRSHVKENDRSLSSNVVSISQTTELLLTGSVPAVEDNGAEIGRKGQRVHFHTHRGYTRKTQEQPQ